MAVDALRQLVQLCDQFEAQWRAGDRPRIEALIADLDEPLRRQATEDLIAIELHWMRRLGERNLLGTYSERFPEHAPFIAQQCGGAGGAVVEDRRRPDFPPIGGTSKLEGGEHSDSAPAAAGRFRAVRPHATGGLGRIWLALDAELKREVAVKELLNEHANRPDARERFVLEAEVTARLEHPGIVPVYGLGTAPDGRPFYAMRLIQGKSLEVAIQELHDTRLGSPFATRRLLETRRLLNRFLAVCAAIDFAHSRGVVHRDIKPANVMLGEFGEVRQIATGRIAIPGLTDYLLPATVIPALALAVVIGFFYSRTVWGRWLLATGRNESAARYSGVPTARLITLSYVGCSLLAGFGGMLFIFDISSAQPSDFGNFYELYAIAAAVLGGCSLRGGEMSVVGVVVGAATLQVLRTTIILVGLSSQLEFAVIGAVLLVGVAADELIRRFLAQRLERQGAAARA